MRKRGPAVLGWEVILCRSGEVRQALIAIHVIGGPERHNLISRARGGVDLQIDNIGWCFAARRFIRTLAQEALVVAFELIGRSELMLELVDIAQVLICLYLVLLLAWSCLFLSSFLSFSH